MRRRARAGEEGSGRGEEGRGAVSTDERLRLAGVYEAKGLNDLAVKEYKEALGRDGKNPAVYFSLGNLYMKMKDYKEAETNFRAALALEPQNPSFHNNLGWLYMEKGDAGKAKEEVREAARLDPRRIYIYLDTLGVIQMRGGDYTEAEENLIEASRLIPAEEKAGIEEIYSHLIELYNKTGEEGKASEAGERLRSLK